MFGQQNMFPGMFSRPSPEDLRALLMSLKPSVRTIICRSWECKQKHFFNPDGTPRSNPGAFDREALRYRLRRHYTDRPNSVSSFDRAHHDWPQLLPWPMTADMTPPWESSASADDDQALPVDLRQQVPLFPVIALPDESGATRRCQLVLRADGVVAARVISGMVAVISVIVTMDGLDGKVDGVIHWCRVLIDAARVVHL